MLVFPTPAQFEAAIAVIGGLVTIASAICAATPTPPPGTWRGRLYRGIEIAGLVVGWAKHDGAIAPCPGADRIAAAIDPALRPLVNQKETPDA